jgi:hypothetical protein
VAPTFPEGPNEPAQARRITLKRASLDTYLDGVVAGNFKYPNGRLVLIGMNLVANQTKLVFEIAGRATNEGSAQNNQARS